MKTIHNTKQLRAELARLSTIPGVAKTIVGTNTLNITADIEGIRFSRSTPQARMITKSKGELEDDGEVCVVYSELVSIISRLQADETTITLEKKALKIRSGKSEAQLRTLDEEKTDTIDFTDKPVKTQFSLEEILPLMKSAAAHASKFEADGALFGIAIESAGKEVRFIGCDRKVMFLGWTLPTKTLELDIVAPASIADSILSAFPEANGQVEMRASDSVISFDNDETEAFYVLMNGGYMNYQQLIDHVEKLEAINTIKVNREDLLRKVGIVAPFGEGELREIAIQAKENELVIRGGNEDYFMEVIGATCKPGPAIHFNPSRMKDLVSSMKGAAVEIRQLQLGIMIQEPDRKGFISAIVPQKE
jgi:DNA polymerase III sliding clamp (beta) subunit (PCNA family)